VSDELEEQATGALRVGWYVDFANLSLSKPSLQRCAKNGWSDGRRMSFDQLYAKLDELPVEDARVFHSMKFNDAGERIATADTFEALVEHPRVFNGARPGQRVLVTRAECHVSATSERGALVIRVTPEGAQLGVNLVAEGEDRILVYRINANTKRLIDLLPQGLSIPEKHQGQALRVLDKLSQSIDVRSKELGQEVLVGADSTPCLRISPEAGAWMLQLGVRPFGEKGRFFQPAQGHATLTHYAEGTRQRTERDFELELNRASELVGACPTLREATERERGEPGAAEEELNEPIHQWVLGEADLLALLSELRDLELPCGFEWPDSKAIRVRKAEGGARSLSANLRRRKGWYLLDGSIRLDELTQVDLADLVGVPATSGRRFVRLPNGDYLELEKRVQRVLSALDQAQIVPGKQKQFKLPDSALGALAELVDADSGVNVDEATHTWLAHRDEVLDREYTPSTHLRADLRSYQVQGFQWLCRLSELGFGACLADDMGLGKTVQIIALLLERLSSGPVLVVAPTSVCSNWLKELERFAPGIDAVEYGGTKRTQLLKSGPDGAVVPSTTLLVTSYGLMQQDIEQLAKVSWGCVILDEAQFIKNAHSQRAKAARLLNARYRIASTGTPVENHLGDLWSIFQFLNPGLLGTWQSFNRRFVKPIERDKSSIARILLKEAVAPFILRRTKSEVLTELPQLTEVQHEVRLSDDETKRYTLLRKQISDKLHSSQEKRQNKLEILAELMRLRRFCCHPRLVFPDAGLESSKVNDFLALANELKENGHRALVFSQFVDFLSIVRERLDEHGFTYQYLDGSTPRAQRSAAVDAFQAGVGDLFLISLKAGGFGLNLTAADYVIHLDPWWNPAVEAQATDRAHRIGQEKPVTVYRLVTKDTIEQSILRLHSEKKAIADALLSEGAEAAQLSTRDLLQLVSGGPALDS
jgi:superfamily II DNA or RNA helicase